MTFGVLDHPHSDVKTHKQPTPYLGGLAVALGMIVALAFARVVTQFPTGTLRSLRGVIMGGSLVLLLGLIDDVKLKGIGYRFKFMGQIVAALCLMAFDIRIHFIHPGWVANLLTIVWVVGITNALNIIDIMDGLASGIAVVAGLGFFFISLSSSKQIYVNFVPMALAGALLGFMPFNFSKKRKIFLGDTGSLFMGFILAALSLGTAYTHVNNAGVFAPILILGVPIYDTVLVTVLRLQKGMSPFLGSLDHYALRLERYIYREEILVLSYVVSILLAFAAYEVTLVNFQYAMLIYAVVGTLACAWGTWLAKIPIDKKP